MKILIISCIVLSTTIVGCNKLEKLEGNNIPFAEKYFEFTEVITMNIPNSEFNFSGFLNCTPLPFGLSQDFNVFIPTQNPNPYAHLVDHITPKEIEMDLVTPGCDFDMMESVEVFLVDLLDSCGNIINDQSQFVFPSDSVFITGTCTNSPHTPEAYYNIVKIGEFQNFNAGIGYVINLDVADSIEIDQFIHAPDGRFQTYAKMVIDKAFTEESVTIKTTMKLDVRLINEE